MRSAEVAASSARIEQAEAEVGTSRLLPNPIVDFGLSDLVVGSTNPRGLGYGETAIYSVGVTQTIELGKRGPRGDAADLRAASSRKWAASTLGERIAAARFSLGHVVYQKAKHDALAEELLSVIAVSELERVRLQQGEISGNDYDRLMLDKMSLEVDIARTDADFAGALARCGEVLRIPCEPSAASAEDLDAAAPIVVRAFGAPAPIEARADIAALKLEQEAADKDAVLASRRAIPDPAIRVGFTHDNLIVSGDQENTLSFSVQLPLPLFDRGQHDARKARAHATELRYTRDAALVAAEADIQELRSRTDLLAKGLRALSQEALPKSETILRTTAKAFDRGQVSMTDLLVVRRTHITLLLTILSLKFDFFTARNDLRRVLGMDVEIPHQVTK
jgi:outer membrane protein, heavy metal efflux system